MTSVLMVVTAARYWTLNDGTAHPTGFWAEELVVPYTTFADAGWDSLYSGQNPQSSKKLAERLVADLG